MRDSDSDKGKYGEIGTGMRIGCQLENAMRPILALIFLLLLLGCGSPPPPKPPALPPKCIIIDYGTCLDHLQVGKPVNCTPVITETHDPLCGVVTTKPLPVKPQPRKK